jgi:small-conductance mechanosensitive channel
MADLLARLTLAASLLPGAVPLAQPAAAQPTATAGRTDPQAAVAVDPEAERERPAAVLLEGEPILWIAAGAGPYSTQFRAERIAERLDAIVHDRSIRDPAVTVIDAEGASELRVGSHLLMVVTPRDAAAIGAGRTAVAVQYARELEAAIRNERLRYAPSTLIRSAIYGAIATLIFGLTVWGLLRVTRLLRLLVARRIAARAATLRAMQAEMMKPHRLAHALAATILVLRTALLLVLFDLYLTFVLGLFPWTRAISYKLVDYAFTPIRSVALAMASYLPKLLFLIVIAVLINLAIRLVRVFFDQIGKGRLVFESFPPEWADPTNKIARVLLIAFGLVVAFPYLPASDAPAFAGVSVFVGVLVSLASSSALSNMIAGIVLTYTGGFKLGDRVKVGDTFGDIIETALLATRVRTIKNEDVTIPNSLALGSTVINYTREATTLGLILHTSVTIGYDAPWRQIHELLVQAALGTTGILADPKPFVWQTALNDFYVTYEINAYTAAPKEMIDIYAVLHSRIQDAFYAAGVEIMSPHVTAIRDGNTIAIPEAFRAPAYQPRRFRVETEAGSPGHGRTPPELPEIARKV